MDHITVKLNNHPVILNCHDVNISSDIRSSINSTHNIINNRKYFLKVTTKTVVVYLKN